MRVHLLQYDIKWEDKAANHARVREMIEQANVLPGDLVVLPEMFDTGFSLNVSKTNDTDRTSEQFLKAIAASTGALIQGAQTIRRDDGKGLNRAIVVQPSGAISATYDKVHPFTYGREGEAFVGGSAVTTYTWQCGGGGENACEAGGRGGGGRGVGGLRVCPVICYDLRFPELFRAGLIRGAEAFAIGANWPSARAEHWRALIIARAIENQAFVFAVNRCGEDPHLSYNGGSMIVAPDGAVLAELAADPASISVEIDPRDVWSWRGKFPACRDRRPGVYAGWGSGYEGGAGPRMFAGS